eukprot:IDg1419t1
MPHCHQWPLAFVSGASCEDGFISYRFTADDVEFWKCRIMLVRTVSL